MRENTNCFEESLRSNPHRRVPSPPHGWLIEGEYQRLSPRTLRDRAIYIARLLWFADSRGLAEWGPAEARQFHAPRPVRSPPWLRSAVPSQ